MRKAHVAYVRDELVGELAIGEVPPVLGKIAAPRAEMDLVNRNRRFAVVAPPALCHPSAVMPDMARGVGGHRRGAGRPLGLLGLRIGLERQKLAIGSENLVFVEMTGPQPGYEEFPKTARLSASHRHPPPIPGVEVADHADPARIRRPQSEGHALDPLVDEQMGPKSLVARKMVSLGEQVNVELTEDRRETVDILEFVLNAAARCAQPITKRFPSIGDRRYKKTIPMNPNALGDNLPRSRLDNRHLLRRGQHCPHAEPAVNPVHAKKCERIVMPGLDDGLDLRVRRLRHAPLSLSWPESRESLLAECRPSRAGSLTRKTPHRRPFRA